MYPFQTKDVIAVARHMAIIVFFLLGAAAVAGEAPTEVELSRSISSDRGREGAAAGKVPTELKGLLNFHEVHPYLFRGGAPGSQSLHDLKDKGIKTLIDLRAPTENTKAEEKEAAELGLTYIQLPMDSHAPTKAQVDTVVQEVEKAKVGKSGPVYVHCAHGSDRTGCMVGIWRVTHDGWSYDRAYEEMRKYFFGPKYTALSGAVRSYARGEKSVVGDHEQSGGTQSHAEESESRHP